MLVSREPIIKMEDNIKVFKKSLHSDFTESLFDAFGEKLMSLDLIDYSKNKIGFSNAIEKGKIAPIIIKFQID
jgi:hypothetical protein